MSQKNIHQICCHKLPKKNKTIKQKQYYKREMKTQLSFQRHMIASGLLLLHKIRRVQIKKNLASVPK